MNSMANQSNAKGVQLYLNKYQNVLHLVDDNFCYAGRRRLLRGQLCNCFYFSNYCQFIGTEWGYVDSAKWLN